MAKKFFIDVKKLSKSYAGGRTSQRVLNRVELQSPKAEFLALLGSSGSGKSTLLNLLSGIDRPDSGEIWINNMSLIGLDENKLTHFRRKNIGFIFQFFNLLPTITALENVSLPLELANEWPAAATQKASQLLESVGLKDRLDSLPDELSGGEQQRVAIARALIHNPLIVLADEPTGNLDEDTGNKVMDLLVSLTRKQGKNLIMATHSLENASRADRVLLLRDGQLESIDPHSLPVSRKP